MEVSNDFVKSFLKFRCGYFLFFFDCLHFIQNTAQSTQDEQERDILTFVDSTNEMCYVATFIWQMISDCEGSEA